MSEAMMTDDTEELDSPRYVLAKIVSFFANPNPTATQASSGAYSMLVDLEESHSDPFPALPRTTVPPQTHDAFTRLLTEDQQTYFLRLFWEAYHPLLPSCDEVEFRSLLSLDGQHPCEKQDLVKALANCMTALGIQYGHNAGLAPRTLLRTVDVSRTGAEYFHRCRNQITSHNQLNLLSMQCYALMSLYLMNASNFGEAYSLLGTAIRNAHRANLHQEPGGRFPTQESTHRRRLWWLLYMLEMRCSKQLGKPVAVQSGGITCAFPSNEENMNTPGNTQAVWKTLSVSTYFIQLVKLGVSSSGIRTLNLASELCENNTNVQSLEQQASELARSLGAVEQWRNQLPEELLSPRKDACPEDSMSMKESPVLLELGAPNWVHHQRLLLEIYYHNVFVMLQRPFIYFLRDTGGPSMQQPQTDHHARSALRRAMAMTIIISEVCSISDVLFGWPEILHPLWNSTMAMFAYMVARPFCRCFLGVKQLISKAVSVFEAFATTEPFAAQAKEITEALVIKLEKISTIPKGTDQTTTLQSPRDSFGSPTNSFGGTIHYLEDDLGLIGGDDSLFAPWDEGNSDIYASTKYQNDAMTWLTSGAESF